MHTLKITSGPAAGQSMPVESEVVIGREHADLTIDDPEVSRRHAAVRPDERGVVVEDLGSINGTFVDDTRISGPVTVTSSGTIRVGSTEIALELAPPPPSPGPPGPPPGPPVAERAPGRRRRPPVPLLLAAVLLLLAGGVGALVFFLTDDESAEARPFQGTTIAAVASKPGPRMTILGLLRGNPTGQMSAIITREVDALSAPGGPPVNLRLNIVFSQPGGSFTADLVGTVQVTRQGAEVVRGAATVTDGTGTYEDITGSFSLAGNNPPGTQTSRFTLQGTLDY